MGGTACAAIAGPPSTRPALGALVADLTGLTDLAQCPIFGGQELALDLLHKHDGTAGTRKAIQALARRRHRHR